MADPAIHLEEAREAAIQGRHFDAANAAERALRTHPDCLIALRALAWAQLSLRQAEAFETFQHCAALDPEDPLAEVGQAVWFERRGDRERAAAKFLAAWEREPHDQNIRKEVVRLGAEFPESTLAEGIGLLQDGRLDSAATALRHAAAQSPQDPAAPLALATVLWRLGGKQQAYNLASTVLASRPLSVKAILYVVAVEAGSGRFLRTRELLSRAEHVDPGFVLWAPLVQELGIQPILERHSASRPPGAFVR
ncbi:MAG: tetratricopeptide repeat protein [Chloroflexi bacterium]|nr:tetratricopeptide repeat protein [Chloroflexota bacterium]